MIKWNQVKKVYNEQNDFWIKVPKDQELYSDESINNKFENVDCYEFFFKNFTKEQILDLVTESTDETDAKTTVKKQIDRFITNILDWKNVKVKDLVQGYDKDDDLEFDREAFDELLANKLWIAFVTIKEVNRIIAERRNKVEEQKKT